MITLKTLPQATSQEVFDQCAKHLLTQNKKSLVNGSCKYRWNNLKCAIGCFISDDEYTRSYECLTWFSLTNVYGLPTYHYNLLTALQQIHDGTKVEDWYKKLKELAEALDLKFN